MGIRAVVACHDAACTVDLVAMLEQEDEVEAAGPCADGPETARTVAQLRPDLVFLDADLPGHDSFDLAASWAAPPLVVFLSSDDSHARRAFDARALDYLLKPVERRRLQAAIARARDQLTWLDAKRRQRVAVKVDGRLLVLHRAEIDRVESVGNYLKLHVGPAAHLVRGTMGDMERELGADLFVRIHRSHLVNVDRIAELHPMVDGDCTVVLRGGARLRMSRSHRERLRQHFNFRF